MKLYGSLKELVLAAFRQNNHNISLEPNQATTYTADRIAQLPPGDQASILVGETNTQTLTNKTISGASNTISNVSLTSSVTGILPEASGGTGQNSTATFPTSGVVVTETSADQGASRLKNKDVEDSSFAVVDATDTTKKILFDASGTTGTSTTLLGNQSANRVLTLPDVTDVLISRTSNDTGSGRLQNKSLDTGIPFVNPLDTSKALQFDTSSNTTGKTLTLASAVTDNRTITFPDASTTVVGTDTAQTLSNKTLTGPSISDFIDWTNQGSTPSSPSSGHSRLYPKTDGNFYKLNSSGVESPFGGSGSGELNVIANPNDAGNWAASAGTITVATSSTTTDLPLGSSASGALAAISATSIKITRASGTSYVYYRWTMPQSLKNSKLKVQWNQLPLAGYVSGDLKLEIHTNTTSSYGGTDATLPLSTDSSSVTSIPNLTGRFTSTFDANSSDYYELRIIGVSGTTALNLANVIVGPGIQPQGAAVSDVIDYSGTISISAGFGAPSQVRANYRRVGNMLEGRVFLKAGTVAAFRPSVGLPSGLTIDFTKVSNGTVVGTAGREVNSGSQSTIIGDYGHMPVIVDSSYSSTDVLIVIASQSGAWKSSNVNDFAATSDIFSYNFMVPISQWAGNGVVNVAQNDVEYAYNTSTNTTTSDTTSFGFGPGGAQIQSITANLNRTVQFPTPFQATDSFSLEVWSGSASDPWIPVAGSNVGGVDIDYKDENTVTYGMGIRADTASTTSTLRVTFGQYASNNGTFGATGTSWASAGLNTYYWRVRKIKAGQAVGFGAADTVNLGLVRKPNYQEAKYDTANGYGSTDTKIRRMSASVSSSGSGLFTVVNDDATHGMTITVNTRCLMTVVFADNFSGGSHVGLSKNSNQLTTSVETITSSAALVRQQTSAASQSDSVTWTGVLAVGDVIRPHTEGTAAGNTARTMIYITAVEMV